MARIGLLAGSGKLPFVFAKIAQRKGDNIIAFGIKGITDDNLENHVDKMHWMDWGDFKKALLLLAVERIKKIIMLGKVEKNIFFRNDKELDEEAKKLVEKVKDKKDYVILNKVGKVLSKLGIEVIDSTTYLKDEIPSKGTLTKREPNEEEWRDIKYGSEIAKELSRYDIGQTIAVKDKTVITVEAMEGTDETIRRAGALTGGDFVIVKVARPNQDMRFDVPLVGSDTLKAMIEAKGRVLALEEKKTLLIDRNEVIKLANQAGISIVVIS